MKDSLRQKLIDKFQSRFRNGKDEPVHSQTIADWAHDNLGCKNDTAGRALRKLAEKGLLNKHYEQTKSGHDTVFYSYKPTERDLLVKSLKNETIKKN